MDAPAFALDANASTDAAQAGELGDEEARRDCRRHRSGHRAGLRSGERVVRAIGYLGVNTGRQADSGAGIEAQRTAIPAEATRRGWAATDVRFIEETASGKNARRPGLERAREALARGDAGALVVSKMDRLSRSLLDFASIMQEAQKQGWALIALDSGRSHDANGRSVGGDHRGVRST